MAKNKEVGIQEVNVLYLLVALLLLTLGAFFQMRDIKTGLIITEYVLVLMPAIIYIKLRKGSLRNVLKINALRGKHIFLIIGITVLSYPVALFFNLVGMTLFSAMGGTIQPPPIPTADNMLDYMILMMVIAVSAGICEEVFFRGLMLHSYEKLGKENAIVITSLLFGVFHFNLQNFLGPVVLGLIFGYLVYRTNSIFAGVVGHITNNGFALTLSFIINLFQKAFLPTGTMEVQAIPNTLQLLGSTIFMAFIAVITGTIAFLLLKKIIRDTEPQQYRLQEDCVKQKTSIFAFAPVFLTLVLFVYLGYIQITQII